MDISFSDTKSLFFSKLFLVVKEFINKQAVIIAIIKIIILIFLKKEKNFLILDFFKIITPQNYLFNVYAMGVYIMNVMRYNGIK